MSWSEDIFISLEREHNKPVGIKMCLPSTTTDTVVNSGCQEKVIIIWHFVYCQYTKLQLSKKKVINGSLLEQVIAGLKTTLTS